MQKCTYYYTCTASERTRFAPSLFDFDSTFPAFFPLSLLINLSVIRRNEASPPKLLTGREKLRSEYGRIDLFWRRNLELVIQKNHLLTVLGCDTLQGHPILAVHIYIRTNTSLLIILSREGSCAPHTDARQRIYRARKHWYGGFDSG